MRPGPADLDRRDLNRIGKIEHGGGMVAIHRPGKLLEHVLVARHVEAEHRRGSQRLPLEGKGSLHAPELGRVNTDHDRQPEAVAEVSPTDPLVIGLGLRLERRDGGHRQRQRLGLERHLHQPPGRAHPNATVADPAVPGSGLEEAGQRVGVEVACGYEDLRRARAGLNGVPRFLAGHVVAVEGVAVVSPEHLAGGGDILAGQTQVPLGRWQRFFGGSRRQPRPADRCANGKAHQNHKP